MSKLAVVFPGQGSQSVGMIADVIEHHTIARETVEAAGRVLGEDLMALILDGPAEKLNSTENTQPALVAVEVALWRALNNRLSPEVMAGHSLGEYSALVCAGALKFEDAISLVRQRGLFMQQAVPQGLGGMAAILGLEDGLVEKACDEVAEGLVVQPANYNSPGQLVIAGHAEAVQRAVDKCKALGAKRAMMLPVSGPFHSALMRPAAEQFAAVIEKIEVVSPSCPILQNATNALETDPAAIKRNLVDQIANPVRWTQAVELLADRGIESLVEVGPGKVLSGLNKRINKALNIQSVNSVPSIETVL